MDVKSNKKDLNKIKEMNKYTKYSLIALKIVLIIWFCIVIFDFWSVVDRRVAPVFADSNLVTDSNGQSYHLSKGLGYEVDISDISIKGRISDYTCDENYVRCIRFRIFGIQIYKSGCR